MFKIRKPKGIVMQKQLLPVVEEEVKEEIEIADVDTFQLLVDEMDTIKSKRKLERFVMKNKTDINSLSSSARHSFLNIMKERFY